MSLSLLTMLGRQNPTRDEKYIAKECIKIVQYSKRHNSQEELDNLVENLNKIVARPIRNN